MNSGYNNLPSKYIQYIHFYVIKRMLGHLQINQRLCIDLINYINWVNTNHKIDEEWFQIIEAIIFHYKLPIIYYLRVGMERLQSQKNYIILKKYKHNFLRIFKIIKGIIRQANEGYQLKNFCLLFLESIKSQVQESEDLFILQNLEVDIPKLSPEEKILYQFIHEAKKCVWKCKRKIRIGEESSESDSQPTEPYDQKKQIQKLDIAYKFINSNGRNSLTLFDEKFLDENYKKYNQIKTQLKNFMENNNSKNDAISKENSLFYRSERSLVLEPKSVEKECQIIDAATQLNDSFEILYEQSSQQEKNRSILEKKQSDCSHSNTKVKNSLLSQQIIHDGMPQTIVRSFSSLEHDEFFKAQAQCRLCCRSFFLKDELVPPQSKDVEYKNYAFPWSCHLQLKLGKTMCSFLNSNGGNIYIGIQENEHFKHKVLGYKYSQEQKEDILRVVREIAQTIRPDIVANQMYDVKFMPVKMKQNSTAPVFIKDRYVIKISVNQGIENQIYTMLNRQTNSEEVYIRTTNEVLCYKNMHQVLHIQKQRLMKQVRIQCLYPHVNCGRQKQVSGRKQQQSRKYSNKNMIIIEDGFSKVTQSTLENSKRIYQAIKPENEKTKQVESKGNVHRQRCLFQLGNISKDFKKSQGNNDIFQIFKTHAEDKSQHQREKKSQPAKKISWLKEI